LKLFCKFGSGSIWTDSRFNRRPTTHRQPLPAMFKDKIENRMTDLQKEEIISKSTIDRIIELYLSLLLINDYKNLVIEGKKYHLVSIYGQLRAILTDNSQIKAKKKPILFALSELLNVELKFYYSSAIEKILKFHDLNDVVLMHYDFEFSLYKLNDRHQELDLNEFLEKNIFVFKSKEYNFRKIINSLSDKLGGSHYDSTLPKDLSDLTNIQLGELPILDKYIFDFSNILIPVALQVPRTISDFDLCFSFIFKEQPTEQITLLNIIAENSFFNFSLLYHKNKCSLLITDLLGKMEEINFELKIATCKKNILSISHSINNMFESELNIYQENILLKSVKTIPLLLFNQTNYCELSINRSKLGKGQNFEFGINYICCLGKILTTKQRSEYVEIIKKGSSETIIPRNKYALFSPSSSEMKILE